MDFETLDWPAYSPDLSRIENILGWLKGKFNQEMPSTVGQLKKCIQKYWKTLDEDFLRPYFDSLPRQMEMLIEN